ncbi:MAG: phospholipase [Pseudomonadota bacterium]
MNTNVATVQLDALVEPLLKALDALQFAQRHLDPVTATRLGESIGQYEGALDALRSRLYSSAIPGFDPTALSTSVELVQKSVRALVRTGGQAEAMLEAYRALRYQPYALEHLYAYVDSIPVVDAFFRLPEDSGTAVARSPDSGVRHVDNERGSKGGYSLYVPEHDDGSRSWPLVVALHGGGGHGRGFLWSWLREARSLGFVLLCPTCLGQTWGLMEPDPDTANVERMVAKVCDEWPIDRQRLLLTGMSDGGTFTFLSGLRAASVFTHLAPISASFHPLLLEMIPGVDVRKRPIYLTHGVHDWMFAIDIARLAEQTLGAAGAQVEYREIADLAHTYPREENPRIIEWLMSN